MAAIMLRRVRALQAARVLQPFAWPSRTGGHAAQLEDRRIRFSRAASTSASDADAAAFVGITPGLTKEAQIAQKNSNVDKEGIWEMLPAATRESISVASKVRFQSWLGHGVSPGKAAIVRLFTPEEADAIIQCMGTSEGQAGVMTPSETAGLYMGRVNTARHLVADHRLAQHIFDRFQACMAPSSHGGQPPVPFLSQMKYGDQIVAVNEKIRLVTTE
ncbi:unnamed protein product, partial [Symbiodinium sp. CCMP2456]